jgi:von Willebrand factor type A domain
MSVYRHSLAALLCTAFTLPAYAEADRTIALILDSSGSMKAALPDGQTRMEAAKAAVAEFVSTLRPDTRLAFRAYGHQSPTSKKDCKDTGLLTGFDAVSANKAAIIDQARGLQPLGYTPITYSLTLAAQDLLPEEAAAHVVVLVSDGKETCEADPCAAAKALAEADAKLVVHTVGIGVDTVTRSQLQCIARVARGSYFDANSTSELTGVLSKAAVKGAEAETVKKKQVVVATQKFGKLRMKVLGGHHDHEVLDAAGKKVDELSAYHTDADLAPGIYSVKFGNGTWTSIEIKAGETTEIKPGYLKIEPLSATSVEVLEPETSEKVDELYSTQSTTTLIPGRFNLKFGNVMWPEYVEVKPGETTTLKPGTIRVESSVGVLSFAVKDAEGHEVGTGASPGHALTLPPGKYALDIDTDKWIKTLTDEQRKMDVELSAGEELAIEIK